MNHPGMLRASVAASLVAMVVAGCAARESSMSTSDTGMKTMSAGDAIAARQRLMKNVGAQWKDIQDKAKAGDIEAIAVNAETLAIYAPRIPAYFPEGSLDPDKSKAKPEIWQKWPEFEAAAKNLETWGARLRDTARTKNAEATQAVVKDFGRQACGACHTPFRVPPKR